MTLLAGLMIVGYIVVWLACLAYDNDEPITTLVIGGVVFALVGVIAVCMASVH